MSELQIALLSIGLVAIIAVYGFGWWQQRRYRRKFGAAFKASHADALYHDSAAKPAEPGYQSAQMSGEGLPEPVKESSGAVLPDQPCALLDARSDFIIELQLAEPGPAAVLVGLWQRKFDFGKPVQVCGLTLRPGSGQALAAQEWERAIAESHTLYQRFRIALQLVDRGGAISAAKLADFRDLVLGVARHIKAQTTVPDIEVAYRNALELDAFCSRVDQMVGVNLIPPGDRLIRATDIAQAAGLHGMTLEADGAFHMLDAHGHSLFSLINQDTVPFQHHTLETFATAGITLLLDVPRVEDPTLHFDQMMHVAGELAGELQASVVNDQRVALGASGLARTRAQVAGVEAGMREHAIAPGSAQARRLFA
ncbi:MAG: cell division protein ZipA C-terminal FtsZ-binding domain-containing protein [Gallionella sp.]